MDKPDTEPDGPLRPRVIDLDAEEIRDKPAEAEAAEPPLETASPLESSSSSEVPSPKPSFWASGRLWGGVAAALLLVFAGAWLYRDFGQRFWPSDMVTGLAERVEALDAAARAADGRAATLATAADALKSETASLAAGLAEAQTSIRDAQAAMSTERQSSANLSARVDELSAAVTSAAAQIETLKPAAGTGGAPTGPVVDDAALDGLERRVAALEAALTELKAEKPTPEPDETSAALLSQALSDLKAKFGAGAAYAEELGRIARMVPAAPGLDVLQPHAAAGLANAQGLAAELAQLVPSLPAPKTEPEPAEPGYWDWILGKIGTVVTVRRLGDPDWRAVADRAHVLAAAGELAQAAKLLDDVEGDMPQVLNDWRARVRARLAAERALAEVSDAVLRQLAALGAAP